MVPDEPSNDIGWRKKPQRKVGEDTTRTPDAEEQRELFEFIISVGLQLKSRSLTTSYAAIYCYEALRKELPARICLHTMACACLLVASKVTNDQTVSLRDVINIAHRTLNPNEPELEIGELYYNMREGLSRMEMLVLRALKFQTSFEHPHQYLVEGLASLRDWLPNDFTAKNIDSLAGTILRDTYAHPKIIIDHTPRTIACVVAAMALHAADVKEDPDEWLEHICPNLSRSKLERIQNDILYHVYRTKSLKRT
ncbi:cyclin domain-containing protein [Aphelenchoides avenae]|nr:cyclin domain-containing protein [Aphelenchus avenae]